MILIASPRAENWFSISVTTVHTGYPSIRAHKTNANRTETQKRICMHKIEWTQTTTNNNKQKLNLVSETSYAFTVSIHSFIRCASVFYAIWFFRHLAISFACCLFRPGHPIETTMELFLLLHNIFIVSLILANIHSQLYVFVLFGCSRTRAPIQLIAAACG